MDLGLYGYHVPLTNLRVVQSARGVRRMGALYTHWDGGSGSVGVEVC